MYSMIDYLLNRVPGVTKVIVPSGEKPKLAANQRVAQSLVGNGNKTYWIEEISEGEDDLSALNRTALNAIAETLELDPTDYKNKGAIIEAILKARK